LGQIIIIHPPDWFYETTINKIKYKKFQLLSKERNKYNSNLMDADTLKKIIEATNLSQRKFAAQLNITQPYLSAVINGTKKLSAKTIEKINKHFGNYLKSDNQ